MTASPSSPRRLKDHSAKLLTQGSLGSTATHASSAHGYGTSGPRVLLRSPATPAGSARAPLSSPLEAVPSPQLASSGEAARTPQSGMTPSPQPSSQSSQKLSPQPGGLQESSSSNGNYLASPVQLTVPGASDVPAATALISSAERPSHPGQQLVTQIVDSGPSSTTLSESAGAPQLGHLWLPSARSSRKTSARHPTPSSVSSESSASGSSEMWFTKFGRSGTDPVTDTGTPQEERPPSPWRTGSLRSSSLGPQQSWPGHGITVGDRVRAPDGRPGTVRFAFSPIEWGVKLDGDVGVYHFTTKELRPVKG